MNFIQVRANPEFEPGKAKEYDLETIQVESRVDLLKSENATEEGTVWGIFLTIEQTIPPKKNIPYEFTLEISGLVAAHPTLSGDQLERVIQVNGPSMLFGAAREILRAATGRGPYEPVIIPSTNFFQRLPKQQDHQERNLLPEVGTKKVTKKVPAKKKSLQ